MLRAGVLTVALIAVTCAPTAASPARASPFAEIVSDDGRPCLLIRGTALYRGGQGAVLRPGDLIATEPGTLLMVAFGSGATLGGIGAVGPSSRLYWMERPDRVALAVRRGWIKVDTLSAGERFTVQAEGPHLGAATDAGTFVLHAGDSVDEVFHETGSMQLWSRNADGIRTSASSTPNQFARRGGAGPINLRFGPDVIFVDAMPPPFRDPLPLDLAARPRRSAEPERLREVEHEDVAVWLSAPRDWRSGLVKRFGLRLGGPGFSH